MDNRTFIGIVVRQISPVKYFISCQDTYHGKDGILTTNPNQPVKVGDWISMNFTRAEADEYFPNPKREDAKQFQTSIYMVIPEYYRTEVDGKTIQIKLEKHLTENQREIDHHFFFKIYNNIKLQFATGLHLLTIKRIEPRPYMQSVWVLQNVEVPKKPESNEISLIGIVAGVDKFQLDLSYVWTKERPIGKDITIRSLPRLPLGTWITMSVPRDRINQQPLEWTKYSVMENGLHSTEIINGTIALKLELWLDANSKIEDISHPFVGCIIKKDYMFLQSGKYLISIKRTLNKNDMQPKSVWHLYKSELIEFEPVPTQNYHPRQSLIDQELPRRQNTLNNRARSKSRGRSFSRSREQEEQIELTGLIVADGGRCKYVFCKDRLPGYDIKINNDPMLTLGKWIKFRVSQQEVNKSFLNELPGNGVYPEFWCLEYTVIHEVHPTTLTGPQNKTITLQIELDIEQNSKVEDLWHPSVCYIINESKIFEQSGRYLLTVIRGKKFGGRVKSVWFLREYKLLYSTNQHHSRFDQTTPQREVQFENSYSRASSRSRSRPRGILTNANPAPVNNLNQYFERQQSPSNSNPIPNQEGSSSTSNQPPRYSQLQKQTERLTPQTSTSLPSLAPTPAPRTITTTSPRQSPVNHNQKKGIVVRICFLNSVENIFVWLIDEKREALLKLDVSARARNLVPGSFFSAPFTTGLNGRLSSIGPVTIIIDGILSRPARDGSVELRIYAEGLNEPDAEHYYPWIFHDYFGDIIDNRKQLQRHGAIKYHFWIKRSRVWPSENYHWVVVEQYNI